MSHARRRLSLALIFLLTALPAVAQKAPPRAVKQYTIEQLMNNERIAGASFSADDKRILFSSNKTGIFNVYSLPVTGGERTQLTDSKTESIFAVSYFPADDRILYRHDQGGNENNHIYLRGLDGKERDLTPGEKVKAEFYDWSRDNQAFYYISNGRDPRFFDVFRMDIATLQPTLLFQNDKGFELGAISPDATWIALSKPNTTLDSDIYLYNTKTKELKHITPHQGEVAFEPAAFDPRNPDHFYLLSDQGSEFKYLARYDLKTGKTERVLQPKWDVAYAYFSKNGKYRVVGINVDGSTKIEVLDQATGKLVPLPAFPEGEIRGVTISDSEKLMGFYHVGDRSPGNLHVYDFATRKVARLTNALNPEIDANDLVEGQVVRYKSFDGMMIPAILFKPHQAAAGQVPAIVQVHGGPGGQSRKGYNALMQFLVNHGYAVLMVNNRGSSGYGKTFFAADDGKHGREPLWDCVEAKKYLESLGYVQKGQVGILGGSYGGYMVLAALAFKPEEFAVGVDIFGVSNWLRTLQSIPPYWESFRKALYKEIGDPVKDEAFLRETSPVFHAEKIRKPLIVLQGANDPRVIKPESDDIVAAVRKNGVPVEYVVFDNEGHGFTKRVNEIKGYQAILEFLDKYLKGEKAAAKPAA